MSQINCSGHFIHSCRRMTPPRSQIYLGSDNLTSSSSSTSAAVAAKKSTVPIRRNSVTSESENNNIRPVTAGNASEKPKPLAIAQQTRVNSQLQSAMWSGESNLVSPGTRSRIIKEDNLLLLGGGTRRFAGRSNESHPQLLFVNPGEKSSTTENGEASKPSTTATSSAPAAVDIRCLNSSGRASHRGRVAGLSSMANSAEFVQSTVGQCTVGDRRPSTASAAIVERQQLGHMGVKKVAEREHDHIENFGYAVRATPVRKQTPPPPLPDRKFKTSLRHVESPCRADHCSEPWDRWGDNEAKSLAHRQQGPKMFPDRNQQTFGFASEKNENKTAKKTVVVGGGGGDAAPAASSSSISVPNSGNNTPQRRSSVTGVGIGRRMISSASSRSSSVENILPSQYAVTATEKKQQEQASSARRSSNTASGVPLTGNIMNTAGPSKGRSSSNNNNNTNNSTNMSGCLNDGSSLTHSKEDIRYVPRKKIVGGNNNTPSKGSMKF